MTHLRNLKLFGRHLRAPRREVILKGDVARHPTSLGFMSMLADVLALNAQIFKELLSRSQAPHYPQ
jgi:hypothetical protein